MSIFSNGYENVKSLILGRWGSGAGEIDEVRIDASTNAMMVIDYPHHEVHSGSHYFIKSQADIGDTETYFMFRTPNTTTRIHAKAHIASEAEFTVEIFEGGTVSADGTPLTAINNNRDSVNTAELANFAGPTVTTDGTLIWGSRIGTGRDATVSSAQSYEILAKTNTIYLFKLTKIAAGTQWVDSDFWWYEHVDRH